MLEELECVRWRPLLTSKFIWPGGSLIISYFHKNSGKTFGNSMTRQSKSNEFHRRCDGHSKTLTMILDTYLNIFSASTSVKWKSWEWNRIIRKKMKEFGLKSDNKKHLLYCDNCQTPYFEFGLLSNHETDWDRETLFTDSMHCKVREIEVFEIHDQPDLRTSNVRYSFVQIVDPVNVSLPPFIRVGSQDQRFIALRLMLSKHNHVINIVNQIRDWYLVIRSRMMWCCSSCENWLCKKIGVLSAVTLKTGRKNVHKCTANVLD
jgi:hypothetical protein